MVNNDGAALHVGAVVDALHGVKGAALESTDAMMSASTGRCRGGIVARR